MKHHVERWEAFDANTSTSSSRWTITRHFVQNARMAATCSAVTRARYPTTGSASTRHWTRFRQASGDALRARTWQTPWEALGKKVLKPVPRPAAKACGVRLTLFCVPALGKVRQLECKGEGRRHVSAVWHWWATHVV
jgi:hypothetical protein